MERAMQRHGLTDREWLRLAPLLPPRSRKGRPPKDHRLILDALLWLDRTGAPWRDLPERFGPWRTVATRFYRWTRSGLWERILAELRRLADAWGGIDWEVHLVDGTSVRAHRCAVGAKGGGCAKRWAAAAAGSAASCTSGATVAAGRWHSC
jgi:transposase